MAATSYTALPSSSYAGLGSQGDLYHAANLGAYDTGIGSITAHPYQYQTRSYANDLPDTHQPTSYADELLRSTYAHSIQQPQYYPIDRHVQPAHTTTTDHHHHQHQPSYPDTTQHHPPAPPESHHHQSHANHVRSDRNPSDHPTPPKPPHHQSHANHIRPEQNTSDHHTPPKPSHHQSHANHVQPDQNPIDHHKPPHHQAHANHVQPDQNPIDHYKQPHHQPHPNPIRPDHNTSDHPTPPKPPHHQSHPTNVRSDHHSADHPKSSKPLPQQQQQQQQQQRHQSQPNQARPKEQMPKQPPPVRHRSPSQSGNDLPSVTTAKTSNPVPETRSTKSTKMRAAAIKKKEETQDEKRKSGNFPTIKKKSTPPKTPPKTQPKQKPSTNSASDDEHTEEKKSKRNKKQPHSVPKQHKSRHDDDHHHTEDNNTSAEEDNHDHHHRSKSKKRAAFSDSHLEKYPSLPPVRHGRGPPFYDPPYDYPYPPALPLRGRHPYYDDYPPYGPYPYHGRYDHRHRHFYDDGYDAPPYVAGHHDPYDGFFDYEKRKGKTRSKKHHDKKGSATDREDHDAITGNETEHEEDSKSIHSKKSKKPKKSHKDDDEHENSESARQHWPPHPYYDTPYDGEALEVWRQERNDYLKKKFKPTIHDVLYSQQWMKSDSYLENQRRRALRDSQGYYFPYKKYTLKDYKDLQKQEAHQNLYAAIPETTLDRKERARKRHEYASQIERQIVEPSGGHQQQHTPRDMPPKKPWHLSHGELTDPDKLSKRERALVYAKDQVVKHPPQKAPKNRSRGPDPTEQYVDSLFPQTNHDDEADERDNQSDGDDDQ